MNKSIFFLTGLENELPITICHQVLSDDYVEIAKFYGAEIIKYEILEKELGRHLWFKNVKEDGFQVDPNSPYLGQEFIISALKNKREEYLKTHHIQIPEENSTSKTTTALNQSKLRTVKTIKLTNTQGKHNKFYDLVLYEDIDRGKWILQRHFGKIGTNGVTQEEEFTSKITAEVKMNDLLHSKLTKGYMSV